MAGETDQQQQYVSCPAPACNYMARRSAVRDHLAERDDKRHADFDGSEV